MLSLKMHSSESFVYACAGHKGAAIEQIGRVDAMPRTAQAVGKRNDARGEALRVMDHQDFGHRDPPAHDCHDTWRRTEKLSRRCAAETRQNGTDLVRAAVGWSVGWAAQFRAPMKSLTCGSGYDFL